MSATLLPGGKVFLHHGRHLVERADALLGDVVVGERDAPGRLDEDDELDHPRRIEYADLEQRLIARQRLPGEARRMVGHDMVGQYLDDLGDLHATTWGVPDAGA